MATFYEPELKQFSATIAGELLTYFDAKNETKFFGIRVVSPTFGIHELLVLKSSVAKERRKFPYLMPLDTLEQLCCSFGNSFHIQSKTSPTEVISSRTPQVGCIVYQRDGSGPALCCSFRAIEGAVCISLKSWEHISIKHDSDYIMLFPKWRLVVAPHFAGVPELEELVKFPA